LSLLIDEPASRAILRAFAQITPPRCSTGEPSATLGAKSRVILGT
jgi:hypothetical protein